MPSALNGRFNPYCPIYTLTMTRAQLAIANYYQAIIELEKTGVIDRHHGDELSAAMMEEVGEAEDYTSDVA